MTPIEQMFESASFLNDLRKQRSDEGLRLLKGGASQEIIAEVENLVKECTKLETAWNIVMAVTKAELERIKGES